MLSTCPWSFRQDEMSAESTLTDRLAYLWDQLGFKPCPWMDGGATGMGGDRPVWLRAVPSISGHARLRSPTAHPTAKPPRVTRALSRVARMLGQGCCCGVPFAHAHAAMRHPSGS